MIERINKLKGERAALVKQSREILDAADKDKRELSADEQKKYDDIIADFDKKSAELAKLEAQQKMETQLASERDSDYRAGLDQPGDKKKTGRASEAYRNAFANEGGFLRSGKNGLDSNRLNVLSTGIDVDGGYLVPEEYETEIVKLLYTLDPIRAAATVIRTASDRHIPLQTGGSKFGWLGENEEYGKTQPSFGKVILGAHKLGGIIPIAEELLQDSATDIAAFIQEDGGQASANLENEAFANGDGSAKPLGIFATNTVGNVSLTDNTGAVSASAAITGDDLIDTFHSLGRAHRMMASWLMSDGMAKLIRKLKDGDNQYLWQPGLTAAQPDAILNRPVLISDYAPTPAVDTRSIAFGNLKKYTIVDRIGIAVQRLNELYAANGQVGFRMNKRVDGRLTDAKAVVFFKHGAAS